MEIGIVNGASRKVAGRHANERLRRSGMIPGIIYGHGENPETVSVSLHDLEQVLLHNAHVIKLRTDAHEDQYLLKDVQYDHLQKTPVHVDLMRVSADERVEVKVPIELRGTPKGVGAGSVLVQLLSDLEVECLLLQIPESIRANVSHLELGGQLKVSELELPADVKALNGPNELVAIVRAATIVEPVAAAAVEGEAGDAKEPEVIGRVAKEEPEEEAGG